MLRWSKIAGAGCFCGLIAYPPCKTRLGKKEWNQQPAFVCRERVKCEKPLECPITSFHRSRLNNLCFPTTQYSVAKVATTVAIITTAVVVSVTTKDAAAAVT